MKYTRPDLELTVKGKAYRQRMNMDEKQNKQAVHFLHIGKTGGSAIKHAINKNCPDSEYEIHFYRHAVKLRDIPKGEKFVFILRDPVTRFVSGFYSRQRQGKPRYNIPWRPKEKTAFETFSTPLWIQKITVVYCKVSSITPL